MKRTLLMVSIVPVILLVGCGGATNTTPDDTAGTTGLRFGSAADFDSSAAAALAAVVAKATTTAQCADVPGSGDQDDPQLEDGLDCDGDGGIVAHVTPSQYSIAFKRVTLVPADVAGEDAPAIEFVPDTGTLAGSEVVNFTESDSSETVVTIDPADLTEGTYSGIEAEVYYFQLTFPVGGTGRNVRIYMSDDDFAAEGGLGHHQGDITFINDDGTEAGWVDNTWTDTTTTRGDPQNGAGGVDAETGHARGFFGDAAFWNQEELVQGAGQDIFVTTLDFDEPLEIPDPSTIDNLTTITITFSVADTFFFENFAPTDGGFSPDAGGEATGEGAAWAPLFPDAVLSVSVTE